MNENVKENTSNMLYGHELVFKQDEGTGITVCFFKTDKDSNQASIWVDIIFDMFGKLDSPFVETTGFFGLVSKTVDNYPKKFGKVVLHAPDTWNAKEGRIQAKDKLRYRLNRAKLNVLMDNSEKLEALQDRYFRRVDKLYAGLVNSIMRYEGENVN